MGKDAFKLIMHNCKTPLSDDGQTSVEGLNNLLQSERRTCSRSLSWLLCKDREQKDTQIHILHNTTGECCSKSATHLLKTSAANCMKTKDCSQLGAAGKLYPHGNVPSNGAACHNYAIVPIQCRWSQSYRFRLQYMNNTMTYM